MIPTEVKETRGRKPLTPDKKRGQACYTLPPHQVAKVAQISADIDIPASRFVEFAIDVALASAGDPAYLSSVKAAAKK